MIALPVFFDTSVSAAELQLKVCQHDLRKYVRDVNEAYSRFVIAEQLWSQHQLRVISAPASELQGNEDAQSNAAYRNWLDLRERYLQSLGSLLYCARVYTETKVWCEDRFFIIATWVNTQRKKVAE